MIVFETILVMLAMAVLLLAVARRLQLPYPVLLAIAGAAVAIAPVDVGFHLDPSLALALFVAPVLLDESLPCRCIRRLEAPTVHFDLYIVRDSEPLNWRSHDLGQILAAALANKRPIIVEGICLCRVLLEVDRDPDFLVWLENDGGSEHGPEEPTDDYIQEFNPVMNADFVLRWKQG
jgi:hypothetical protein